MSVYAILVVILFHYMFQYGHTFITHVCQFYFSLLLHTIVQIQTCVA